MLFGMVDVKDNWVMNPCNYRPNIGLTRLYWINDLESTKEEYEQATEMSAADEWLKGLDKERNLQLQEIEKIEKWESSRPAHLNPEHNEFLKSMPMLSRGSSGKLFYFLPIGLPAWTSSGSDHITLCPVDLESHQNTGSGTDFE